MHKIGIRPLTRTGLFLTCLLAATATAGVTTAQAANGGTTHEFVYHAAGNLAGEAWFNSGSANPSKGQNSFTIKDLFCGDGWSIYVKWVGRNPDGSLSGGVAYLHGDCDPVERSLSVSGPRSASLPFSWSACKWDTNHLSADTCEPWINTTWS
ncbi:hypothetical protein [Actinomadura rupiterrae]|uniref:hypothetical protein n=1 Tax=Actinomadura rupiterrae TaxID=559627 RepID=UPI0020A4F070|nr:hypothetical protein [Actinomadura rupiterrae]MCP2338694.1 YD repeat-containing protein [Actinomadura rupiterrae]